MPRSSPPLPGSGFTNGGSFAVPPPFDSANRVWRHLSGRGIQLVYLALSLAGLTLLVLLYSWGREPRVYIPYQAQVTGTVFIAICVSGLAAAVSPRFLLGHGRVSALSKGHHPDCGRFRGHVIMLGGRLRCAGCSGLALGAMLSIIGSVLFFYAGLFQQLSGAVFWLGVVAVALGLIQHFIDLGSPHLHLLLNVALVFGSFILVASMRAGGASFFVEAFSLGLAVFWVAARIMVSQEEHALICGACGLECGRGYRAE